MDVKDFVGLVIKELVKDKQFKSLSEKINHPDSKFRILKSTDYQARVEYPVFSDGTEEELFNLNEVGVMEAVKFLKEKYQRFLQN